MSQLSEKQCMPCHGGTPSVSAAERESLLAQLNDWSVVDNHHLNKVLRFDDFLSALAFVNQVGEIAEAENHHPSLSLEWGRVGIDIWTHAIDGLSENDFVLAAKIDALSD